MFQSFVSFVLLIPTFTPLSAFTVVIYAAYLIQITSDSPIWLRCTQDDGLVGLCTVLAVA